MQISILGEEKTGKSIVGALIVKMLERLGYNVSSDDEGAGKFPSSNVEIEFSHDGEWEPRGIPASVSSSKPKPVRR